MFFLLLEIWTENFLGNLDHTQENIKLFEFSPNQMMIVHYDTMHPSTLEQLQGLFLRSLGSHYRSNRPALPSHQGT